MGEIKVALIGCGYWGSKLRRYIEENQDFEFGYVCNSKSDLNEVWSDERVSAVVVATPIESHYLLVKESLLHGRHVLAEKPLALRTEECEELRQLASDKKLSLLVEYTWTFSRAIKQAQRMVGEGKIGKPLGIEMSVRHLGRFKGGSVYWLLGSHMLSVLDMFIPLRELQFERNDLVTYDGQIETGSIMFRNNDLKGEIVVSLNYPGKETRIAIYGQEGTMIYDAMSQPALQVERYERLKWTIASKLPREHWAYHSDESNNLRYAIEYFFRALKGKVKSNIDTAVTITRILEEL